MASIYERTYADWKYLFDTVGVAHNMTGAYQDQYDLDRLIRSPSKATAVKVMMNQMAYWFRSGIEFNEMHMNKSIYDLVLEYPRIADIADTISVNLFDCPIPFAPFAHSYGY